MLLPAAGFLEEAALWEQAPGSPGLLLPPHLSPPSPLWALTCLPASISLAGWGCTGQLWLRGRAGLV